MIDWQLESGETILWEGRPRLWGVDPIGVIIWGIIVYIMVQSVVFGYERLANTPTSWESIAFAAMLVVSALLIPIFVAALPLQYLTSRYCLTNRRLLKITFFRRKAIWLPIGPKTPIKAMRWGTLRVGKTSGRRGDSRMTDWNELLKNPVKCILMHGLLDRGSVSSLIENVKQGTA